MSILSRLKKQHFLTTLACTILIFVNIHFSIQPYKLIVFSLSATSNSSYSPPSVDYNLLREKFHALASLKCPVTDTKNSLDCLDQLDQFDKEIYKDLAKDSQQIVLDKCQVCLLDENSQKYMFLHHTFFHANSEREKHQIRQMMQLNVMSFLYTQNLCCTKLIVWILKDFDANIINDMKKLFSYYIHNDNLEFKVLKIKELCAFKQGSMYSLFKEHRICNPSDQSSEHLSGKALIALSDFVRFFVLDLFGGIYTDGDVIYLKDTRILWNENFLHRWSFVDYYNTAVMGLNKYVNSSVIRVYKDILGRSDSIESLIHNFHPIQFSALLRSITGQPLYQFDCFNSYSSNLFDPAWLCNDGQRVRIRPEHVCQFAEFNDDFLIKNNLTFDSAKFFPGAFTFHLHLRNKDIQQGSYFYHFDKLYRSRLRLN